MPMEQGSVLGAGASETVKGSGLWSFHENRPRLH